MRIYPKYRNDGIPHLSIQMRLLLIPIMIPWFILQLVALSGAGGVLSISLGIMALFATLFDLPENRDWGVVYWLLFSPFISPFVWIKRYIKFGEYNSLEFD